MVKNYLIIAWRNLMKDKTFTFINIFGLSVAFGVAILLSMAAFYDLSYDKFHENGDHIYKMFNVQQTPKGAQAGTTQPAPFAEALKSEVPGVDKITRYLQDGALTFYGEKEINFDAIWVDADFFSMFSFPVLIGDKNNPLKELSSVVVSKTAATKLFGAEDAIGQTVNIMIKGKKEPFTISAVVADHPLASTLEFEMALRFENNAEYAATKESWDSQYQDVYVQLQNGMAAQDFEKNSGAFTELHYKGAIENMKRDGAVADADGLFRRLALVPLKDVHFTSSAKGDIDVSRNVPYLILGVAFLILFIACVNFINMSIAKSSQRLKEIGMRKTLGAEKKQLFFQFWIESLFVFMVSVSVGIFLSVLLLDDFKTIFQTDVSLELLTSPLALAGILVAVFLITLIVGGYPALLLSRLGTLQSLKGKLENSGSNRVRNGLMVLQFCIAILFISGTLVLWGQVDFMRNKDLGYNKEQVLSFPLNGKRNSYDVVRLLREELRGNPDIISVSASDNNLGIGKDGSQFNSNSGFGYKGRIVQTNGLVVDYDYLETLGLELVQGRSFDKNRQSDTKTVIINESMAKELGEEDPLTARLPLSDSLGYSVIGVVKDYHFQELSRPIQPLTFFLDRDLGLYYAYVKVAPMNMARSLEIIEAAYKNIEPNANFLGSFLDENVDRTFKREKIMATMITSGSVIAIALSCMGLFAMSLLIVSQRTKEIGVRKVLGASVTSITVMLTKDFLILVLIAFLIATPIAWWFMRQWLENYVYKVNLGIWFFVVAGLLAMAVAILTVGSRTIKAALQNPVKSLRTE